MKAFIAQLMVSVAYSAILWDASPVRFCVGLLAANYAFAWLADQIDKGK